jgi:hypothetical protein
MSSALIISLFSAVFRLSFQSGRGKTLKSCATVMHKIQTEQRLVPSSCYCHPIDASILRRKH